MVQETNDMNVQDADFDRLKSEIANGSEAALESLVERHSEALARVIRRRLHQRMRSQFDTLDFQQIVWASVLENLSVIAKCESSDELESCLAQIARHKVIDAFRRMAGRDNWSQTLDGQTEDGRYFQRTDAFANDPTPSHVVRTREEWQTLVNRLPYRYRRMVGMLRAGYNFVEVADALGVHERTVRRLFGSLGPGEVT